ncbi:hypothetical protein CO083_06495 [Candidatus Roizmanbacteria bacterium CG_4_9_14_0_8_um_filter_34_12]|uniref:Uncharacterized protein n=5 Tax=Candidatus Roizmaniibacteriota TaxID=1752723 RepID=A0A2M8DAX6_9BACT|nr:MAG: hypothetical protein CO083_06495 [Candidatus Roizmanbacteria bacterium CG_4_9_14_0_8_um_filter_34_12]
MEIKVIPLLHTLLFILWYISLMILAGYIFFLNRQSIPLDTNLLIGFFSFNFLVLIGFILMTTIRVFIKLQEILFTNKLALMFFILLIIVGIFSASLFLNLNNIKSLAQKQAKQGSVLSQINTIKNYYLTFFFNIIGYPTDKKMTTEKELIDEINLYRVRLDLPLLSQDDALCSFTESQVNELETTTYSKHFESIRVVNDKSIMMKKAVELAQTFDAPVSASQIVSFYWIYSHQPYQSILEDPQWDSGCVKVSRANIITIFGKKN